MKLFSRRKAAVVPGFPCPCCGFLTLPLPQSECLGFICDVCYWEIDLFMAENEPSDCNHGLTLAEAQSNYRAFDACAKGLVRYVRPPEPSEYPPQN